MLAPTENPSINNWKTLIPSREDTIIEDIDLFKDHIVLYQRCNGSPQIVVYSISNNLQSKQHIVNLPNTDLITIKPSINMVSIKINKNNFMYCRILNQINLDLV